MWWLYTGMSSSPAPMGHAFPTWHWSQYAQLLRIPSCKEQSSDPISSCPPCPKQCCPTRRIPLCGNAAAQSSDSTAIKSCSQRLHPAHTKEKAHFHGEKCSLQTQTRKKAKVMQDLVAKDFSNNFTEVAVKYCII